MSTRQTKMMSIAVMMVFSVAQKSFANRRDEPEGMSPNPLYEDYRNTKGVIQSKVEALQKKKMTEAEKRLAAEEMRRAAEKMMPDERQKAVIIQAMRRDRKVKMSNLMIEVGPVESFLIPPGPFYGNRYDWYAETVSHLCYGTLNFDKISADGPNYKTDPVCYAK